ncbi:MBL fold metallo-hydrolase [Heyndrickxia acidicola]|uniref:MBL fold metallo-hydrolase n=1 Tax=Heyndrickxia acidicola TaxID=209389 RepID=A0ABU6MIM5_9BACI|nr:MBL fold metallo-hydrolase [Heyndrickxia acidicola]MED1204309.1 MBL fold metallo-hydrolase [Heyndrickxia acidicola]
MSKKRFENLDRIQTTKPFKEFRQWRKERRSKQKDLSFQVSHIEQPEIEFLQSNNHIPTVTWIGHSTFLLQYKGLNILTDPVWARQMGTDKRLTPPGLSINDLPSIDFVLISHSHYDHLHYSTIKKLPGNPAYLVPSGLAAWFHKKGLDHVHELNWWEQIELSSVQFSFVPAQHWTKRTLFDTNTSHWGGWMLTAEKSPVIYFAGDSGYFRGFSEIGERFTIDYALVPIGAYEPEWFMKEQHVNPEEAVKAFIDTKAKYMIPMHYGTFRLADDTPKEALDRVQNEWTRTGLEPDRLLLAKLGETLRLTIH